ncbi:discoidin domain-containing protein [Streptococcus sp. CSL10205-OR2]|nr:discoidin domain-containing protein [Streptococcus sp. CSL10205-OR2]MCU9533045.1 discoidin domain-containing protein [Streptococcus sp. CSL10205-OR2]
MKHNQSFEKRNRYGIRKLSVGIGSVLIGMFFLGIPQTTILVQADETTDSATTETIIEEPTKEELAMVNQPKADSSMEATPKAEVVAVSEEVLSESEQEGEAQVTKESETNIALNKTYTSSGVEANTTYIENLAFDGNLDTRYSSARMKTGQSETAEQTPQWLQIDLGKKAEINSIEVDFFKKVYATDYVIESSADGQGNWQQISHRTDLHPNATLQDPKDTITFTQPVISERYLRFHFNKVNHFAGGNAVSVKEIAIMGKLFDKEPATNLALNKTYSSSGIETNTSYTENLAFDGNFDTRYSSARMKTDRTATSPQTPQWLQIDLGQKAEIESITLDFFKKVYATDYVIESSADGQGNWQEISHRTQLQASESLEDPQDLIIFGTPITSQRYLRFHFNKINHFAGGNAVSVKDIAIMGRLLEEAPETSPATNLAPHKAYSSSGIEAGTTYTADLAFDENTETRYSSARMKTDRTATSPQTPQWLQIDLGRNAEIESITLDFFKKVYATDYVIESSADGQNNWQEISHRTSLTPDASLEDPKDVITFSSPVMSNRFLRFRFNKINHFAGGNAVSVNEITIMGRLTGEAPVVINPQEKLEQATLAVDGNRVVLANISEDDVYSYEIIGSNNQYLVDNQGNISSYRLNDQTVTLLVAVRNKATSELLATTKMNKTIQIGAHHEETVTGTNQKPQLAIDIQEFLAGEGLLSIAEGDTVYVDSSFQKQVDLFNEDLQNILGFKLSAGTQENAKIKFILTNDYNLKEEGYLLRVLDDTIEVYAHDAKAFNYAAVTMAQMLQKDQALTRGVYRDYPNYEIRGMVLDVARVPMRMDFLQKVSKLFRWYKLNELHLHFNDNQWPSGSRADAENWKVTETAHRLESPAFPSLNKQAFKHDRYEGEYDFYRNVYGNPAYSIEDFKAFQEEIQSYGAHILAEFDNPGHSAHYSLYALNNPDNIDYLGKPIHHPSDLEALAINEQAYPEQTERAKRFIKDLIDSYLDNDILSYSQIHLGVDEYWEKNGNIESFRNYLNELNQLAKSHGKTLRTWGALTQFNGQTPVDKDIIFDEWAQYESLTVDRINEGYRVVNVPQPFTYVTPGRYHKDIINEQYVFEHWNPRVFNLGVAKDKQNALEAEPLILGAKGALWGDEHREGIEESDLYDRLEKSLAMIGYKTWSGNANRSFIDYQKALEATKLKNNYLPLKTNSEVLVNIDAAHVAEGNIYDLSSNNHVFQNINNVAVVELEDNDKWFAFNGDNYLASDIETISLPYTLEMTIRPTDSNSGSLLASRDGAIFLNKKGRRQSGEVVDGFMLNRYFYSQNITNPLEAGKDYKLTFTATREALIVYINGEQVASFAHQDETARNSNTEGNFRTSFNLPFKKIGEGFKGYIKDIKVYNRFSESDEIGKENLEKVNIALHKPVYSQRNNSAFFDQGIRSYSRFKVTDGDLVAGDGRWNSSNTDSDFFIVDLENPQEFSSIEVIFDNARIADSFKVLASNDLESFTELKTIRANQSERVTIDTGRQAARYVKFETLKRQAGKNEIGVREFRVYQTRGSKEELATAFKQKAVALTDSQWLAINNVLNNKFASNQAIQDAKNQLGITSDTNDNPDIEDAENEETVIGNFGAIPSQSQLDYHKQELAAFIHFGMNTFTNREWGNGQEDVNQFNPTELDTDQWIKTLKDTGFKRTIMVVKHHDGFVLYPTEHSNHSVASSPWKNGKGDVLLELSESATKYNMDLGVYLSPWDANHPKYSVATQDEYNAYYLNQLKEILGNNKYGNNGKFVEVWMDGARGSGAQNVTYTFEEWFNYIREQEGDITIFSNQPTNVRWIGNERGIAGDPIWHKVTEQAIKNGPTNAYLNTGDPNGDLYSVGEADVSIRPGWFYHANQQPKSLRDLMTIYFKSVGRGTPLLLNIPPDKRGKFADADIERLHEFHNTIEEMYATDYARNASVTASSTRKNTKYSTAHLTDGDDNTTWALSNDATTGSFIVDLGQEQTFDVVELKEFIQQGQRIAGFRVDVEVGGQWIEYGRGSTVGYRRLIQGKPVTTSKVRVTITDALATPILSNFSLYKVPTSIEVTDGFPLGLEYKSNDLADTKNSTWRKETEGVRGTSMWTNQQGASAEYTFSGTKAYVVSTVDPNHGIMEIYIDGQKVDEVNTQSSVRKRSQLVYETSDLTNGQHTIKLVAKTNRAIATEGIFVLNNDGNGIFEIEQATYHVAKGENVSLVVKRNGSSDKTSSIKVITEPGTGVHGKVYQDTTQTLTFAPGETSKTIDIPTIKYPDSDGNLFDFFVKLVSPSEKSLLGFTTIATINVVPETGLPDYRREVADDASEIIYHGTWFNKTGTNKWSNFPKNTDEDKQDISLSMFFEGEGIEVIGHVDPGHGIYIVELDGQPLEFKEGYGHSTIVDGVAYFSGKANQRQGNQKLVNLANLSKGVHSLTIRLDPNKNDKTQNIGIQVDKFITLGRTSRILSKADALSDKRASYEELTGYINLAQDKVLYQEKLDALKSELERNLPKLVIIEQLTQELIELISDAEEDNNGETRIPNNFPTYELPESDFVAETKVPDTAPTTEDKPSIEFSNGSGVVNDLPELAFSTEKRELKDDASGVLVQLEVGEIAHISGISVGHKETQDPNTPNVLKDQDYDLFDISLVDAKGNVVSPLKDTLVIMPIDDGKVVEKVVYLPNTDQEEELDFEMTPYVDADGVTRQGVVFVAKHFSEYGIVYKEVSTPKTKIPNNAPTAEDKPVFEGTLETAVPNTAPSHELLAFDGKLAPMSSEAGHKAKGMSEKKTDQASSTTQAKALPNTGDNSSSAVLGTMLALSSLALYGYGRKRRENEL